MNEKNLEKGKKTQFTKSNASQKGKKGGVASGKAKRDRKLLRDCLEVLLETKIKDKNGTVMTGAEAMAAKIFQMALKGDLKAWELVRDTAGQKPIEKVLNANIDPETAREVEEMVRASLPELQKMVNGERTEPKEEAET